MNIKSLFYKASFLLFAGISAVQCQDGSGDMEDATDASGPIVYAAGREGNEAKYWKNGNAVALGKGSGGSDAKGMAIVGDDVHVVGYEVNSNGKYVARYWKNGVATDLTDGSRNAYANDIFISGNDIYIAGQEMKPGGVTYEAKYWKNGTPVTLTDEAENVIATGIAVLGNDIYVIGERRMANWLTAVTCYWKNGQRTDISNQTASEQDITVSGNDIYMMWSVVYNSTGQLQTRYSKNLAAPTLIQDGSPYFEGTAISVKGNDVYIAGTGLSSDGQSYVSRYCKNGSPVTVGADGSFGLSLYLSGNDIYVAGYQQIQGGSPAVYWKNGIAKQLTKDTGSALIRQIVVKEQ